MDTIWNKLLALFNAQYFLSSGRFGFDISELAYKSFWSDSFEAMGDYLRGSA